MFGKSKHENRLKDLEKQIDELRHEIDYLHSLLEQEAPELPKDSSSVSELLKSITIPNDIYDEIYKYCENKNYIFMGVC